MEPEASSPLSHSPPLSASYARSIQSTIPAYFLNTHLRLGLESGVFPPSFPNNTYTNTLSKTPNAVTYTGFTVAQQIHVIYYSTSVEKSQGPAEESISDISGSTAGQDGPHFVWERIC
jgi:hypothetical protein